MIGGLDIISITFINFLKISVKCDRIFSTNVLVINSKLLFNHLSVESEKGVISIMMFLRINIFFLFLFAFLVPKIAAEHQVVFFCGAGAVQYEDCVKDMNQIKDITNLSVKMFFPSGQRSFPKVKYYNIDDFENHEVWIRKNFRENQNVHYIFVASSQGWIPFNNLVGKLKDIGVSDKNYDVILNQPAGSWATGVLPNKLPHKNFSFDNLAAIPRHVINLRAPDFATADRFDEPSIKFSQSYYNLHYGPITNLETMSPVINEIKKHSTATGVGLANEVPSIINILSHSSEVSINVSERINHILSEGARLRQHFFELSVRNKKKGEQQPNKDLSDKLNKKSSKLQTNKNGLSNPYGGVSMKINIDSSESFNPSEIDNMDNLRNQILKDRPSSNTLSWPVHD